jgi:hypothetical protein
MASVENSLFILPPTLDLQKQYEVKKLTDYVIAFFHRNSNLIASLV